MAEQGAEDKWILQHYNPLLKCQTCLTFFMNNKSSLESDKEILTMLKQHLFHTPHNIQHDSVFRQGAEDEWVLQYYSPILMCHECDMYFFDKLSYEDTLPMLKVHSFHYHKTKHESVHNEENDDEKEKLPLRRYMRQHYSKLKGKMAKCRNCFAVINYSMFTDCRPLYLHLKNEHSNKLTDTELNERKFNWVWDYFTIKDKIIACTKCVNKTFTCASAKNSKSHLKSHHNITGPSSGSDTDDTNSDTGMGTTTKKAKLQDNSEVLSQNLYEMAEGTSVFNESTPSTSESTDHVTKNLSWEKKRGNLENLLEKLKEKLNWNMN